jgi:hypothetical protein
MAKEISFPGNHICCYGIVTDPEIYDGGFKETLMGFSRENEGSAEAPDVKMSFKGSYLLFLDAGNCFFKNFPLTIPGRPGSSNRISAAKAGIRQRRN